MATQQLAFPRDRLIELAARSVRALALDLGVEDPPLSGSISAVLLVLHLAGLGVVVRLTHHPVWLAFLPLLLVQPVVVSIRLKRPRWFPESLTPLGLVYSAAVLRIGIAIAMARPAVNGASAHRSYSHSVGSIYQRQDLPC